MSGELQHCAHVMCPCRVPMSCAHVASWAEAPSDGRQRPQQQVGAFSVLWVAGRQQLVPGARVPTSALPPAHSSSQALRCLLPHPALPRLKRAACQNCCVATPKQRQKPPMPQ